MNDKVAKTMLEFILGVAKGNGKQQDAAGAGEKRKCLLDDEYKDNAKPINRKRLLTSIPPPPSLSPTIKHLPPLPSASSNPKVPPTQP